MLWYLLAGVIIVFLIQFLVIFREEGDVKVTFRDMKELATGDTRSLWWFTTVGCIIGWPIALGYAILIYKKYLR